MTSEEMKLRKREEYEMQFFGFHSRAAYDGMKNIIKEEIQTICQELCKSIENKYQLDQKELSILRTEAKILSQTYENRAETHMEELNNIVRKFISIPNNVLLEEDKGQTIQVSQMEFEQMKSKLEDIQEKAKRVTMFNAALHQELKIQQSFKACEDAVHNMSEEIKKNTILPNLENEITKFAQASETLNMQLSILETSSKKDVYNPTVGKLKKFDPLFI